MANYRIRASICISAAIRIVSLALFHLEKESKNSLLYADASSISSQLKLLYYRLSSKFSKSAVSSELYEIKMFVKDDDV